MTTTSTPSNPYGATLVAMPAASIDALLRARAGDLDFHKRTIRNAIRAARRQGRTLYVGRTATGAYINADASALPVVDVAALADGTVYRYDGGGSAYDGRTAERQAALAVDARRAAAKARSLGDPGNAAPFLEKCARAHEAIAAGRRP